MITSQNKAHLQKIVKAINNAWNKNRLEELEEYFHENMIIADSNFNKLAKNKKECIASYQSFINQAKILGYTEREIDVEIIGETAIVNYIFNISWEVNNSISSEEGRDVFVVEYSNGKWLAVFRTLLPIL